MGYWSKPNRYMEHSFIEIPEGSHRVRIVNVRIERFNKGKTCYNITLKVSGYHGLLWYHLWYDPENKFKNSEKFKQFFASFQIEDTELAKYKDWVGKAGAVYVSHYDHEQGKCELYAYEYEAKVTCCLSGRQRDRLPPWKEAYTGPYEDPLPTVALEELPF